MNLNEDLHEFPIVHFAICTILNSREIVRQRTICADNSPKFLKFNSVSRGGNIVWSLDRREQRWLGSVTIKTLMPLCSVNKLQFLERHHIFSAKDI